MEIGSLLKDVMDRGLMDVIMWAISKGKMSACQFAASTLQFSDKKKERNKYTK